MKYAYRLGKSLMLPVACLPVAGLLMGIGFWMDPVGHGDSYLISQILVKAGSILIDHMSLLFTLGVAVGMADEQDGTAALAGVVSWLVIQQVLTAENIRVLTGNQTDLSAFAHIDNQLDGILCGLIGASCINKYRFCHFPGPLCGFRRKKSCSAGSFFLCICGFCFADVYLAAAVRNLCLSGRIAGGDRIIGSGDLCIFEPAFNPYWISSCIEFCFMV